MKISDDSIHSKTLLSISAAELILNKFIPLFAVKDTGPLTRFTFAP